jgi:hypothetical protein
MSATTCPYCLKMLQVPEFAGGKLVKCPLCGKEFRVPAFDIFRDDSGPGPKPAPPPLPRELRGVPSSAPLPPGPAGGPRVPPAPAPPPPSPPPELMAVPEHQGLPAESHSPADGAPLPVNLRHHLLELEQWAQENRRDAFWDTLAFWSLKIPAILAAASAGVWAHFELTAVSVIAGAVASACVIIDGIHPRGMLRNLHLRAYHDLRALVAGMMAQWRSRNRRAKEENVAANIISGAEEERKRIAAYIREAETALDYKTHT